MQLEWECTKEPLFNGADSRFHEAAVWVLLPEKERDSKDPEKNSFRPVHRPEDIDIELRNSALN